jgi:hypothetical protein
MFVLDYAKYQVLGRTVELFRDETSYGFQCVGIIDDFYLNLGDLPTNIETAMTCWEKQYRILSSDEREQILLDNGLKSGAV